MIPAWVGVPGLIVLAVFILLIVVGSIVKIVEKIKNEGVISLFSAILKQVLFLLFISIVAIILVIGYFYGMQLARLLVH